jgi:hypothetical protein
VQNSYYLTLTVPTWIWLNNLKICQPDYLCETELTTKCTNGDNVRDDYG